MNDEAKGLSTEFNAFNIMSCLALLGGIVFLIGLWNGELLLSEKGFYGISFFLSLF